MKKTVTLLIITLFVVQTEAQNRADRQSLSDRESFSMILLGDPQAYVKYDINQPILELCTAWIADNIDQLHIKSVLCTGDLVEQNENIVCNRAMLNQTSREMWEASSRAFARLDNKVPYIISCGNHDYGYRAAENASTHFPEYFPFERNSAWRNTCVSVFPNRNKVESLENAAFAFHEPCWGDLLVITTEFYPRNEVLTWAKNLADSDPYKNYKIIVMTHAYMEPQNLKNQRLTDNPYSLEPGNNGEQIWKKLLEPTPNIGLLICGHTATGNGEFADNVGFRTDKNKAGKTVNQMMFNVQTLGGGWEGNGGDGWLRILEFLPDGKTVRVRTYSPLFGISSATKHLAHRKESFDEFEFTIE
ncbi:MAG: metallophosphoesterase [Candidatus Symbiothrix sp.]|jgi:hypothetical protein|nr:metallophosphoesterase [Candidatus Symbiothrix sp.]